MAGSIRGQILAPPIAKNPNDKKLRRHKRRTTNSRFILKSANIKNSYHLLPKSVTITSVLLKLRHRKLHQFLGKLQYHPNCSFYNHDQ
jgi:hypothetical protein